MTEKTITSRRVRVRVAGTVQGVGFRPFVHNLAADLGVSGWCRNDPEGVVIEAEGTGVDGFVRGLTEKAPPLAVIEELEVTEIAPEGPAPSGHFTRNFEIRESEGGEGGPVRVLPDTATCPDCLRELFDPGDRRRLYPFINCTNCGPRYSIIKDVPYDRPMTTMAGFTMCAECESEYRDPAQRRFHAQPNACPACGPRAWLAGPEGEVLADDTVEAVRRAR
ncbi:MAG TPA: acylphosphatase, partial [Gammaproteobacteria bacterium]|nr:acylphosphatase [Gammaproteobacteria bacterium]